MTGITAFLDEFRHALLAEEVLSTDATLTETWAICESLTHLAGTRLLERRLGSNTDAGDEVLAYLWHFKHVSSVSLGAPVRVPKSAVRALQRIGIVLEGSREPEILTSYLCGVRSLSKHLSDHANRRLGCDARPLSEAFGQFQIASELFEAALCRSTPYVDNFSVGAR
jgi:hypothetical protein